ncbi:TetR family transcriptional regulator [Solirubrobacter pauli]|uniref:TetR family transcriptional regulator n=1 Tax=Solirubrobacter pauli TaxID=166793 RepID=A0A660LHU5_9ACTN|nr:TetR family transcriptional regulator [Solirubrobacter pauli]RKQ92614.1 TetR family transcriptional regulator [Solirubrobacter pauli]
MSEVDGRRAAGAETRRRLLAAASEILAGRGEPALTLRAVSAAAEANVAAVQYHFGSREALVAAVVTEATRPVVDAQLSALDALDADATPRALVKAWALPLVRVAIGRTPEERRLGRIVGQTLAAPFAQVDVQVRALASRPADRLIAGLDRALPHVGEDDLTLRVALMSSALAGFASGAFEPWLERAAPDQELEARLLERLVRLATS